MFMCPDKPYLSFYRDYPIIQYPISVTEKGAHNSTIPRGTIFIIPFFLSPCTCESNSLAPSLVIIINIIIGCCHDYKMELIIVDYSK